MRSPSALFAVALVACASVDDHGSTHRSEDRVQGDGQRTMELGAFSISLAVTDLAASRAFYEKLGFSAYGGDPAQNWLILRNGNSTIGLFQGMFDKNILTFNPGWSQDCEHLAEFQDVRDIQRSLEGLGLELASRADEASTGPASLVLLDPDGNPILLDQHVPRPGS